MSPIYKQCLLDDPCDKFDPEYKFSQYNLSKQKEELLETKLQLKLYISDDSLDIKFFKELDKVCHNCKSLIDAEKYFNILQIKISKILVNPINYDNFIGGDAEVLTSENVRPGIVYIFPESSFTGVYAHYDEEEEIFLIKNNIVRIEL